MARGIRRKLKIGLSIVVVAVVALVIAVYATLQSLDLNAYRDDIAERVSAATGRDFRIAGAIKLEFGLTPSLSVSDVSLANAPGSSRPEMTKIETLGVQVRLLPLLSGDIEVTRLVLDGADLLLEVDDNGRGNWTMGTGTASSDDATTAAVAIPEIADLLVRNVRLTYRDGENEFRLRLDSLAAHTSGGGKPLAIDATARLNETPLRITGTMTRLKRLAQGEPLELDMSLAAGNAKATLVGKVTKPLSGEGLVLATTIDVPELSELSGLAGAALPKLGPLAARFELTGGSKTFDIGGFDANLAGTEARGAFKLALAGPRPALTGTLRAPKLNLNKILPAGEAKKKAGDGRVFPDDPLPWAALSLADVRMDLAVGKLTLGDLVFDTVKAKVKLAKGALTISPATAKFADGALQATFKLNAAPPGLLALDVALDGADMAKLVRQTADRDLLRGRLKATVKAKGRGGSVRALMASLDGRADAVWSEGYVASQYLDLLAADLIGSLLSGSKDEKGTPVNCAIADFPITKGLANAKVLLFDTERMTVSGAGTINLADETLDLKLKPKPKDASLVSLATPVNVTGTLAEPSIAPDTLSAAAGAAAAVAGNILLPGVGLLLPLLSAGSDKDHPCHKTVSGGETASKKTTTAAPTKAPAKKDEGGIGGFLKNLGDKIDKTLGESKQ